MTNDPKVRSVYSYYRGPGGRTNPTYRSRIRFKSGARARITRRDAINVVNGSRSGLRVEVALVSRGLWHVIVVVVPKTSGGRGVY